MRDWKMWHKNAGRENVGLENTAQEILGWKMREKSVWKANRCFIWQNGSSFIGTIKTNTSYIFSNNCLKSVNIGLKHYTYATPILFIDRPK